MQFKHGKYNIISIDRGNVRIYLDSNDMQTFVAGAEPHKDLSFDESVKAYGEAQDYMLRFQDFFKNPEYFSYQGTIEGYAAQPHPQLAFGVDYGKKSPSKFMKAGYKTDATRAFLNAHHAVEMLGQYSWATRWNVVGSDGWAIMGR